MRHFTIALIFAAAVSAQPPSYGPSHWSLPLEQLCNFSRERELLLTTATGENVQGVCFSVTKQQVRIKTGNGIVDLAKAQLSRVQIYDVKPHHQIQSVGRFVKRGLAGSVKMIPTPFGLAGILGIGGTLASGAVALPFAGLGDLFGYSKSIEVRIQ